MGNGKRKTSLYNPGTGTSLVAEKKPKQALNPIEIDTTPTQSTTMVAEKQTKN